MARTACSKEPTMVPTDLRNRVLRQPIAEAQMRWIYDTKELTASVTEGAILSFV